MKELHIQNITDYKKQMVLGIIPKTYKGFIEYMMSLRTYFIDNYPEYNVGSFYQGYMDMTYFPIATPLLKTKKLKLAVVFDHFKMRFEIWLSAQNRKIINEYLSFFQNKKLNKNYFVTKNPDSIIEIIVIEEPDFKDLNKITSEIETGLKNFLDELADILK